MEGAYFLIEVAVGSTKRVYGEIKENVPHVEAHIVTGPYDIISVVRQEGLEKIRSARGAIEAVPGVIRVVLCGIYSRGK